MIVAIIIGGVIFVALIIGIVVFFVLRGRGSGDKATQNRLDEFVGGQDDADGKKSRQDLAERGPSELTKRVDKVIEKQGFSQNIQTQLAQANLQLTTTEYLMLVFISMVGTGALTFLVYGNAITIGGVVLGFFLPRFYLARRRSKRLKMFNDQLGDTINLMANGLRSGYSILQASLVQTQ